MIVKEALWLVIEVDWDGGEVTAVATERQESAAVETALQPSGRAADVERYVLSVVRPKEE